MIGMTQVVYDKWRDIMENKSDPRTTNWLMMSSPLPTIALTLSYIFAVKVVGPRLMRDRKAFNIEKIQLCYNAVHLLINIYLFKEGAVTAWFAGYSYRCQSTDFSTHGMPLRIAQVCWWYYFSKFTDYFETIIFVLGKRFDLTNFYHVAHHSIMPVSVWWGVKFLAGGHATFFGFLNTFVHIVIYTYLVLVAAFPESKKYFKWWKSFLPKFQIAQFALIFLHAFQLIWRNDCNFPMVFVYYIGSHGVLFYFILMYDLKWSKSKSVKKEKLEDPATEKLAAQDDRLPKEYSTPKSTKSFDIIFNYDNIVKMLADKKQKEL